MIEIKKRRIMFGVLVEPGKYDEEKLSEMIAKKNKWSKENAKETLETIYKIGKATVTENIVKTEKKEEKKKGKTK